MLKVTDGNPVKAILIKESAVILPNLKYYYGSDFVCYGMPEKANTKERKRILADLKEILEPVKVVLVADSETFKALTSEKGNDGICIKTTLGNTFQVPNYNSILFNLAMKPKLDFCMQKVEDFIKTGVNAAIGSNVLVNTQYQLNDACNLNELYKYDALTMDIETSGLKFYEDKLISIAFSWDKHSGIAIHINNDKNKINKLREFFEKYTGKKIFHNASFDVTFLIYTCFMSNHEDWTGMLKGLHIMCNNLEDTRIIAYLSLNSCGKVQYGLKQLAYEYTGNYAQEDINNAECIPVERLLPYNLTDTCATWYVYDKYYPIMKADNQEKIYKTLMIPSLKTLIETQLVGMRIDPVELNNLETTLNSKEYQFEQTLKSFSSIISFESTCKIKAVSEYNSTHKKIKKSIDDFKDKWLFNFSSNQQLSDFLYNYLGLPIIAYTKKGNPSVDGDTLKELILHTDKEEIKDILNNLYNYFKLKKIMTAFLEEFKRSPRVADRKGLYGNFNLCGTKSGRLSSSNPNLQQIPSTGSPYAKPVKEIFKAPKGYVFVGADQRSLEDRISALTTKDTNKLKVYTDGFDGHCLRAYSYFKEQMPDITKELEEHPEDEINIINSIKGRYKDLRQASKSITFALTYGGTYHTLMVNCGLSEEQAKQAESRYHELYKESDKWVQDKLNKAKENGYITCAFGLRLRTPLLKNSITEGFNALKEASKEGRTAGNALGQSWCLLNSRSANDVMKQVWESSYATDILPVAQIHDAMYFFIKDDLDVLVWFNKILIKAMEWQEDPEIAHDKVKLGGDLELFIPSWAHGIEIPNNANKEEIIEVLRENKK